MRERQLIENLIAQLGASGSVVGHLADEERLGTLRRLTEVLDYSDEERSYQYEIVSTDIALKAPQVLPLVRRILESGQEDETTRYLCFAVLFNAHRRARARSKARVLIEQVAEEFRHIPLYSHFVAMSYEGGSLAELKVGLDAARAAYRKLPRNAGVLHTYALYVADLASAGVLDDESEVRTALDLVDRAIDLFPERARFFHTRARLRRVLKQYERAYEDIARAVDMELSQYHDRVSMYLVERATIEAEQSVEKLTQAAETSIAEIQERLGQVREEVRGELGRINEAQTRMIEAVAFIAAALALIQTTVQQASAANAGDRGTRNVVIILGALAVILFGAVGLGAFLLRRASRGRRDGAAQR